MATEVLDHGQVLYAPEGQLRWDEINPDGKPADFTKLVVGVPNRGEDFTVVKLGGDLPRDFAVRLPKLTHLSIYGATDPESLPLLPAGLKCLDVRFCQRLSSLYDLPKSLEILVLQGCENLEFGRGVTTHFPGLIDCCISNSPTIAATWVNAMLSQARSLIRFEALHCTQLTSIDDVPESLRTIKLSGCKALKTPPKHWHPALRRIDLNETAVSAPLPDLPELIDYVDLVRARSLRALPPFWGQPTTLKLFGSGVLMPPASEHGDNEEANVAEATRAYFDDVELVGQGEARRCKLLLLGNGGAGKTKLSLALDPKADPTSKPLSTHGVQFRDIERNVPVGQDRRRVPVHVWDFGGQEIYHNTHRIFIQKGALFVLLWKPPDAPAPQVDDLSDPYIDVPRSLEYWVRLIKLSCPHHPRIAVVCSHSSERVESRESLINLELGSCREDVDAIFFVESATRAGEFDDLQKWIDREVGALLKDQGTAVPAHWELAQEMVEGWIKRLPDPAFASTHNEVTMEAFAVALDEYILIHAARRFGKLHRAIKNKSFALTPKRVEYTLSFLSHSGWLFWDRSLYQSRAIIGQQWALDGIYALLDRRPSSPIFPIMSAAQGRFRFSTVADLAYPGERSWRQRFQGEAEALARSYMERCDLCFKLVDQRRAWSGEDVYLSFEHLPACADHLETRFDELSRGCVVEERAVKSTTLHRLHWQRLVAWVAQQVGADADYARDAMLWRPATGEAVLVRSRIGEDGFGGSIELRLSGDEANRASMRDRLGKLEDVVSAILVGRSPEGLDGGREFFSQSLPQLRAFLSYAHREGTGGSQSSEVVDRIHRELLALGVKVERDVTRLRTGDRINDLLRVAGEADLFLFMHCDRYWTRPDCVLELRAALDACGKKRSDQIIAVRHPTGRLGNAERDKLVEHWATCPDPREPRHTLDEKHMRSLAISLICDVAKWQSDGLFQSIDWEPDPHAAIGEIKRRIANVTLKAAQSD